MSSEDGGEGTISSSSRTVRRSRSRFGRFPSAAVRRFAACRASRTAGDFPAVCRLAISGAALSLAAFFGGLLAVFLAVVRAVLFATVFLFAALFDCFFALFFDAFFALVLDAFFALVLDFVLVLDAFFAPCVFLALFFDAFFAPFAFFALFFDAFDLAIGEPHRPSTGLRPRALTG